MIENENNLLIAWFELWLLTWNTHKHSPNYNTKFDQIMIGFYIFFYNKFDLQCIQSHPILYTLIYPNCRFSFTYHIRDSSGLWRVFILIDLNAKEGIENNFKTSFSKINKSNHLRMWGVTYWIFNMFNLLKQACESLSLPMKICLSE